MDLSAHSLVLPLATSHLTYIHTPLPCRDLKPSNVLLADDNVLKITDFGLSKDFDHSTQMSAAGTFAYMAPETTKNKFSRGSDVWAYGVLAWSLLTGQPPYKGMEGFAVAFAVASRGVTPPILSSFPAGFHSFLRDTWKAVPGERASFEEILRRLDGPAFAEFAKRLPEEFAQQQTAWVPEIEVRRGSGVRGGICWRGVSLRLAMSGAKIPHIVSGIHRPR